MTENRRGTPDGWVAFVVRIPEDLYQAVKAKAAAEDRSMAQAVRHALRVYCARSAAPACPRCGEPCFKVAVPAHPGDPSWLWGHNCSPGPEFDAYEAEFLLRQEPQP